MLSPSMNKGIPELIGKLGVKAFFQDMMVSDTGSPEARNSAQVHSLELRSGNT